MLELKPYFFHQIEKTSQFIKIAIIQTSFYDIGEDR
jgi:hypothetical protein